MTDERQAKEGNEELQLEIEEKGTDNMKKVWAEIELIRGYREMSEINLACAEEFFPLEEEVERAREKQK